MSSIMRLAAVVFLSLLATGTAWAETPKLQPVPDIPPPPGMADQDLQPQVTIKKKGESKVEEFRIHGRLYMIKVTPPHGRPYYLVDERGDGFMHRFDTLSPNFMVPMWMIFAF
jgi:hypothetical protein